MSNNWRLALAIAIVKVAAQVYTAEYNSSTITYTVTQDTGGDVPLASKNFEYPYLPYHADTGDGPRGTQQGYNICNSTTLGDQSLCQTGFVNSASDFCLWGSPTANETVADVEEEMVAYCTNSNYGTRVLPAGAIQGLQFIQTPDYVEIVGYIDQVALNLQASDYGGEEDPHGADQRGNPLGSLLYSSAFGPGQASPYQQVTEWSYFVGGGIFCFKACDPAGSNAAELCQHIYDRIGCTYNDPVDYAAINGTFSSCKGDDQLPPGVYVENGQTMTYYQPPESDGVITTVPYVPYTPSTSQCTTYSSNELFTGLKSVHVSAITSAPSSMATTSGAASMISGANQAAKSQDSGAISLAAFGLSSALAIAVSSALYALI